MKKIETAILKQQAELAMANAPNTDWQQRGGAKMVGKSKLIPVRKSSDWEKKLSPIGQATVAFFKFVHPLKTFGGSVFSGFTLAVMDVKGKLIYNTGVVIGKLQPDNFRHAANMSNRFCPQCGSVDTVKQRSRRIGPECVAITYHCKCGYRDHDVLD